MVSLFRFENTKRPYIQQDKSINWIARKQVIFQLNLETNCEDSKTDISIFSSANIIVKLADLGCSCKVRIDLKLICLTR